MLRSEIRKDYIQEKYVIIAPQRKKRPYSLDECKPSQTSFPCQFCPAILDREPYLLEVGNQKQWLIKVVANKYPAVSLDNPKAYGVQEIVVETPNHNEQMEEMSPEHIAKIFEVYAARTKAIMENKKIEYILIFKNAGGRAGASLKHSHSQIFATHFLPPHLMDKSQRVQAYKLRTGRCVYCDVIKKERKGPRLVYQDKYVIAFTPWASMYNYEIWILPLRHLDNVSCLSLAERLSWARVLKKILKKIVKLGLPYNYYFHQVVHDTDQHLYMKITPRGSVWAGVEIGSGLIINSVSPEEAAKYYRQ